MRIVVVGGRLSLASQAIATRRGHDAKRWSRHTPFTNFALNLSPSPAPARSCECFIPSHTAATHLRLSDYIKRLLGLASTIHQWGGTLTSLDQSRRERLAIYADTLARAAEALVKLESDPANRAAARTATREFGRILGYVETIVHALRHHLDGRKLWGVKRRLEQLGTAGLEERAAHRGAKLQIDRLAAAEGYFRALADALRA